jgi:hypothetical protein
MTAAINYTATKLNRPGTAPRYEYRGFTIYTAAGSSYGRGWLVYTAFDPFHATTLQGIKDHVDAERERQAADFNEHGEHAVSLRAAKAAMGAS